MKATAKFADWAKDYGVSSLATDLGVSRKTPYSWFSGRSFPRPETAAKIVKLSKGKLVLGDILTFIHKGKK